MAPTTTTTTTMEPRLETRTESQNAKPPIPNTPNNEQRNADAVLRRAASSSRGTTPARDPKPLSTFEVNALDPEALRSALKKAPPRDPAMNSAPGRHGVTPATPPSRPRYGVTPPRSRSISRAASPGLETGELDDESLPEYYKVSLKATERNPSKPRESHFRETTPLRSSRASTPARASTTPSSGTRPHVPEFQRVILRRTPSRDDVAADGETPKRTGSGTGSEIATGSDAGSDGNGTWERRGSYSSLTNINKTVLSRRGSNAGSSDVDSAFKHLRLRETSTGIRRPSWSLPGSRAGSPTLGDEEEEEDRVRLRRAPRQKPRGKEEEQPDFVGVRLKKAARSQGSREDFRLESVDLKPIPGKPKGEEGEEEEKKNLKKTTKLETEFFFKHLDL